MEVAERVAYSPRPLRYSRMFFKGIKEHRMDTDDFYEVACFNSFYHI